MERTVAWSNNSHNDRTRRAALLVDDTVTHIRNRGYSRGHALRLAAQELGLRLRRARALLYGDPVVVLDDELARIRAAFLRHLEAEAQDLALRSAASRERLHRMKVGDP
jgi:hypothetical protein